MAKPELLLPAGDLNCLKTAIKYGADAIYFGAKQFSARASATNLTVNDIKEGIKICHDHNAKAYAALNTLIFNDEVNEFLETVYLLINAGADALIVQDIGAAALIHDVLPEVSLHGSTQMVIHNQLGAKALEEYGFSRVVLARECSLLDIETIARFTDIELEVFVHGALCYSYSGACLLSSFSGGRSGNRGECAQPCRKKYKIEKNGKTLPYQGHFLSLKDLNTLSVLPQLLKIGICSLKVEGRMKKPDYIAAVTQAYRRQIDAYFKGEPTSQKSLLKDMNQLTQVFNREGFTTASWFGRENREVFSLQSAKNTGRLIGDVENIEKNGIVVSLEDDLVVGDGYVIRTEEHKDIAAGYIQELIVNGNKVEFAAAGQEATIVCTPKSFKSNLKAKLFKTYDRNLSKKLTKVEKYKRELKRLRINFFLFAEVGQNLQVYYSLEDGHIDGFADEFIVPLANQHKTSIDEVKKQLSRLGNTPYELGEVQLEMIGEGFLPSSILNDVRRKTVALLQSTESGLDEKPFIDSAYEWLSHIPPQMIGEEIPRIAVSVRTYEDALLALQAGVDEVILNLTSLKDKQSFSDNELDLIALKCRDKDILVSLTTTPIIHDKHLSLLTERLEALQAKGFNRFHASNIGLFYLAKDIIKFGSVVVDYQMNILNDLSITKWMHLGADEVVLSIELSDLDIKDLSMIGNMPLAMVVAGDLPLMTSAYCSVDFVTGGCQEADLNQISCLRHDYHLLSSEQQKFRLVSDEYSKTYVLSNQLYSLSSVVCEVSKLSLDVWRIEGSYLETDVLTQLMSFFIKARNHKRNKLNGICEKELEEMSDVIKRPFTHANFKRGIRK